MSAIRPRDFAEITDEGTGTLFWKYPDDMKVLDWQIQVNRRNILSNLCVFVIN